MSDNTGQASRLKKLVFILELKIKRNDWLLACQSHRFILSARVRKQPIIALYFGFMAILEFYNVLFEIG